ncbi:hypothetical protein [Actinocorallia longicatena]|uniref:hypothetical protein n=1 Tax=Actinocorallia longicatena TaxID=111803 RepID=UPI0031D008F6
MVKIFRLLAAPFVALTLVLTASGAPARAEETDAQLATDWQNAWNFYKFYQCVTSPLPWTGRGTQTRDIAIDITAPAARVFSVYSDFRNHLGLGGFLRRVAIHSDTTAADGVRTVNSTAIEDVPTLDGLPPLSIKTHAQQRLHASELYFETDSWTLPNVVTHQKIVFTDLGGGVTRVSEHLVFEANLLLIDYTAANGVASHQATQAGLKNAIESGAL